MLLLIPAIPSFNAFKSAAFPGGCSRQAAVQRAVEGLASFLDLSNMHDAL